MNYQPIFSSDKSRLISSPCNQNERHPLAGRTCFLAGEGKGDNEESSFQATLMTTPVVTTERIVLVIVSTPAISRVGSLKIV